MGLEYKRNIMRQVATLVLIFTLFPLVGNMKNAEKVGFFTRAERLIIYKMEIDEAKSKSEEELNKHIIFETSEITKVFKNITVEDTTINTDGCYYARLYQKDGTVVELIFADYGKAFVRVGEEGRIYRYGLVNQETIIKERE